jgi:hypothetical protein
MKARVNAGLSLGQAARLIGVEKDVLQKAEVADVADLPSGLTTRMTEVYRVDPDWMLGAKPLRDYDAMKNARGYENVSQHDKDIIAEFAASLPKGNETKARELLKGKKP